MRALPVVRCDLPGCDWEFAKVKTLMNEYAKMKGWYPDQGVTPTSLEIAEMVDQIDTYIRTVGWDSYINHVGEAHGFTKEEVDQFNERSRIISQRR